MLVDTLLIEHEMPCMSYKSLNFKLITEFLYNIPYYIKIIIILILIYFDNFLN